MKKKQPTMFTLIGLAIGPCYFISVFEFFFNQCPKFFFREASVLTTLVFFGEVIQEKAQAKTYRAVKFLLALVPEKATKLFANGNAQEMKTAEIEPGDFIRVHSGKRIAADGQVYAGNASIDESMLPGQGAPVQKDIHSHVLAGTLNKGGILSCASSE